MYIYAHLAFKCQRCTERSLLGVEHEAKTAKFLLPMPSDGLQFFSSFFLGGGRGLKGKTLLLNRFLSKLDLNPFQAQAFLFI